MPRQRFALDLLDQWFSEYSPRTSSSRGWREGPGRSLKAAEAVWSQPRPGETEVMGGPAAHRTCLEADIGLAFDPSSSPAIDRACREERRMSPVLKLFLWEK